VIRRFGTVVRLYNKMFLVPLLDFLVIRYGQCGPASLETKDLPGLFQTLDAFRLTKSLKCYFQIFCPQRNFMLFSIIQFYFYFMVF
jgi:hypothetical protein